MLTTNEFTGPIFTPVPVLPLLIVSFGEPQHGWLPVTLQADGFELQLNASAVPINPLELLCEALATVSTEGRAKVMWNLEPAVYWFIFEHQADTITLEITEALSYNQLGTCILRIVGSTRTILFPFHKALAEFTARELSDKHWPVLAENRIKHLGKLLRSQR